MQFGQRRRPRRPFRLIVILVGIIGGGMIVAWLGGYLPLPSTGQPPQTGLLLPGTLPPTWTPAPTPTPPVTITGSSRLTPADAWANDLLNMYLDLEDERITPTAVSDLNWWQNPGASDQILLGGGGLRYKNQALEIFQYGSINILTPDPANPQTLTLLGTIISNHYILALSIKDRLPSASDPRWLISSATPEMALRALVAQAEKRNLFLTVAITSEAENEWDLILVAVHGLAADTPTPAATRRFATLTPTITLTATSSPTPTPTRQPDPVLQRLIASYIDPVIDQAARFDPLGVLTIHQEHPRTGLLTWTEDGPQLNNRSIAVGEANELVIYSMQVDSPEGTVYELLSAYYESENSTTRLPIAQMYFQGHRMEEILFWIVRRGVERGGQFQMAYDDFGVRQSLIITGFIKFSSGE